MKRVLEAHSVVDEERGDLQHRREDPAAAGGADREPRLSLAVDDHRTHVGERPFRGSEGVRRAGARIEPHHAVVHQDTRAGQDDLAAEHREQRLREGHHVAVPVDDVEMRRAR